MYIYCSNNLPTMISSKLYSLLLSMASVDEEKALFIISRFGEKEVKKGDILLRQSQISDEYFFLEEGFIREHINDLDGNEITINFFGEGQAVYDVASFFQRIPAQGNFTAVCDSKLCFITYDKLNQLFHTMPEFREFGRALLVKGFIEFKMRTVAMINKTAEERYLQLIKTKPEIFMHAPLKHIASYLGITDTSLSRIRKSFLAK